MIRSHFKLALRHLQRDKGYAAIHLIGLAVGMASVLLVTLYVQCELCPALFVEMGLIVLLIALTAAGGQALRAASMNPVAALHSG